MPTAQLNLQTFLDRVASIVDRAIGEQNSFIRISMRPLFSAAWSEVEQGLPSVRSAVGQLSDDVLAGVGLSGAQLFAAESAGLRPALGLLLPRSAARRVDGGYRQAGR